MRAREVGGDTEDDGGEHSVARAPHPAFGLAGPSPRSRGEGARRADEGHYRDRHGRARTLLARPGALPRIRIRVRRERGVDAAYTIASFETFDEIARAFERGDLRGMSITAPFKEEAFAYAERVDAHIRGNARACGAINTLDRKSVV